MLGNIALVIIRYVTKMLYMEGIYYVTLSSIEVFFVTKYVLYYIAIHWPIGISQILSVNADTITMSYYHVKLQNLTSPLNFTSKH